jgi:hypothetical protein
MLRKSAERYRRCFEKGFLDGAESRFTPEQVAGLRAYGEYAYSMILQGREIRTQHDLLDANLHQETRRRREIKGIPRKVKPTFRPGLTLLVHELDIVPTPYTETHTRGRPATWNAAAGAPAKYIEGVWPPPPLLARSEIIDGCRKTQAFV